MPLAIVLTLALALGGLMLLTEDDAGTRPAPALRPAPLERIVAGVERARGLRFARTPDPLRVTPARARAEAAASLDADYPPARRRADADVLVAFGLVPRGTDLGAALLETYESGVAGYYDPRSGRLRIVEGAQSANRVLYETTVAHELDHALEDQRFGLDSGRLAAGEDRGLAYMALVEGSATVLMTRYIERRFGAEERFGSVLASAFAPTGDLPPFLTAQLVFPYLQGERFVSRLLEVGGGGWSVVDAALRFRPPASTEQVLHPDAYLRVEEPRRVALRARLGPGWRTLRRGVLGEWMTGQLLARAGGSAAARAAAGWGGDAYALLGAGDRRALVARWRWDTPRDTREFAAALRAWARDGLPGSSPAGRDAWRTPDGAAAVAVAGDGGGPVTLAIAPESSLARRLAFAPRPGR